MSQGKAKFIVPAVGAAVIAIGGIGAYMYLKGGPSGDISGAVGSAKVVPDDAVMATYISTDPQAWAKLEQFGTPEAQKLVNKGLEEMNKGMADSGISYDKDLKPWVGGVMVALLPPTAAKPAQANLNTPQTQEPNVLMVVGIKDKLKALDFANKLKADKTVTSKEIDYKGEKITETSGKGKPTYSAIVKDYVVFSQEKNLVEQAIDTSKGEPSFASKEGANAVLSKGVELQNTLAQIYVPNYSGMIEQLVATNPQAKAQLTPQTLKQLKQVKSMVAGVGIDDAGIRMKAVANLDPQLVKFQYQNTDSKVVSQLPGDTIALVSGQGVSTWWSAMVEQSKDYPEIKQVLEQARTQLKTAVNLDLDKEVFGWMSGEFGIAAIPSDKGILAPVGFGGAMIFHTSDRKTAEGTFTKLDTWAKSQRVNVAQANLGGKNITEWQVPGQGAVVSHGWLDDKTLFVALGGPIAEAIATPPSQSLDKSDSFKAITGSLQKPNGGYFYLDMDKTMTLVNRFYSAQKQTVPAEASAILASIKGFGVTAASPDKSSSQVEMLLALKPKTAK